MNPITKLKGKELVLQNHGYMLHTLCICPVAGENVKEFKDTKIWWDTSWSMAEEVNLESI